jgi:hypothetical protein
MDKNMFFCVDKIMIKYIALIGLFLSMSLYLQGQEWIVLKNDSLHFSIESPGYLVAKENVAMTEVGNLKIKSFGLLPKQGDNLLYQLIIMNYPAGTLSQDSVELHQVMLNELVVQSASANEAIVIYKEEVFLSSLVGIQWRVHSGQEIVIKSRAFIYDDKIYIVQVMSKTEKSLNSFVNQFLDSFLIEVE